MPDLDPGAEKEALIQGYVEGCLTPEESARLHELVREDPLLARVIAQSLRMDGAIRELVGEKEPNLAALPPALPEEPPRRASRQTRITRLKKIHGPGGARSPFPFVAILAAACLLLVIVVVFNNFKKPVDSDPRAVRLEGDEALRKKFEEEQQRAQEERRRLEHLLLEFERKREDLKPPPQSAPDPAVIEKLDSEREKIIRDLKKSTDDARRAQEALDQIPAKPDEPPVRPPGPPKIEDKPSPVPATRAAVAKVERVEGEVHLVTDGTRTPLTGTRDLLARQGIESSQAGGAVVSFGDKTRVTLGPETSIREVRIEGGKRAFLERGVVGAVVTRQPSAQPMALVTPHGEAVVVGTALRLTVVPGAKGFTRLEVTAGKVRLKNAAGKSADVAAGFQAVAAEGVADLQVTRIPKSMAEILLEDTGEVGINFGPDGLNLPKGFLPESGQVFDPQRGYGWEKPMGAAMQGNASDVLRGSYTAGGGAQETVTWRMRVPNGTYIVSVCVGGPGSGVADQGPHHVVVEGKPVVNAEITHNSRTVDKYGVVTVNDGELTLSIGGHKSPLLTSDGTQDTVLTFIHVTRARSSGRK